MTQTWAEVSCEIPAAMVDALSAYLIELSGNGVTIENLSLDTFSLESVTEAPTNTVKAYFGMDESLQEKLRQLAAFLVANGPAFADFTYLAPVVAPVKEEDWANNWKEYFKPVRIGKRVVVKPSWEEFAATAADLVLEVDPGMAFGTGTHPTTRLCLAALEQIACHEGSFAGLQGGKLATVLDVGTGSGILSIGAVKFGASRVVAIDIDPQAVEVAEKNLALNQAAGVVEASTTPLEQITGSFDLVLANILAEELVRLAPELVKRLERGGFLVLSGILIEKESLVSAGFARFGLAPAATFRDAEWSCLVYRREL